jgi:hypothetical protein
MVVDESDRAASVIIVSGGSGLVGRGIQWALENAKEEQFRKRKNEQWIFLSSADGDLRYHITIIPVIVMNHH